MDAALRDLGEALAMPAMAGSEPDLAARVRLRIEADQPRRLGPAPWWIQLLRPSSGGTVRRSLLLAAAALLVAAAAVTAAIGFGLPGIQILFGTPPPSAAPTGTPGPAESRAPGATLGLGTPVTLEVAQGLVDFPIVRPADPSIGPPDAVYLAGARVTLVWGPGPGLPGTADPGIGLLLVQLRASIDETAISKVLGSGSTIERVSVAGADGYWISGERHGFAYLAPDGSRLDDSIRVAGNTLAWTDGGVTYRLEGEFTRDAALALAEALR